MPRVLLKIQAHLAVIMKIKIILLSITKKIKKALLKRKRLTTLKAHTLIMALVL